MNDCADLRRSVYRRWCIVDGVKLFYIYHQQRFHSDTLAHTHTHVFFHPYRHLFHLTPPLPSNNKSTYRRHGVSCLFINTSGYSFGRTTTFVVIVLTQSFRIRFDIINICITQKKNRNPQFVFAFAIVCVCVFAYR